MLTREDIESFLDRLAAEGASYTEVEPGLWLLKPGGQLDLDIVVHYSPPVVLFRVKVMELPRSGDGLLAPFYRRLLELNASDIVHGSYGIEENDIVLSDALELEDLDYSELRSSYESMVMAATSHVQELAGLIPVAHEG